GRHVEVEKRMRRLEEDVNGLEINRMEMGGTDFGIITSGISYTYVREFFPGASVLKLGAVHPLPGELIREFCGKVNRVFVVEELDPFIENQVRAMGLQVTGKELFPLTGELSPDRVAEPLRRLGISPAGPESRSLAHGCALPSRPPSLCPGCPHRAVFQTLRRLRVTVTGDIGCYTLGALPPFNSIDTCVEMGGSIGLAQGIEIAEGAGHKNTAAVLGDSTFAHSGLTGLLNAAYNKRRSLIIVLDNGTTAMTGMQPNPLSGERINGEDTVVLDYRKLAGAVGIGEENVRVVDAYRPAEIERAVTELIGSGALSLLVVKGLCVILKKRRQGRGGK
ncbi:MAG: thiamine pyrophosphate-dependent enzyme, partial [Spirochaetota bacterium]